MVVQRSTRWTSPPTSRLRHVVPSANQFPLRSCRIAGCHSVRAAPCQTPLCETRRTRFPPGRQRRIVWRSTNDGGHAPMAAWIFALEGATSDQHPDNTDCDPAHHPHLFHIIARPASLVRSATPLARKCSVRLRCLPLVPERSGKIVRRRRARPSPTSSSRDCERADGRDCQRKGFLLCRQMARYDERLPCQRVPLRNPSTNR